MLDAYLLAAAAVLGAMTVLWILSIPLRDVSIIDSFWSLAFVICAWVFVTQMSPGQHIPPRTVFLGMVTLWGFRLALHIALRHIRHGQEDPRYQAMRRKYGDSFLWKSYPRVFLLQGILVMVIAPPLLFAFLGSRHEPWLPTGPLPAGWLWTDLLALVLFAVGFFFEAVGDWQLTAFRADPKNRGKVLDTGLWRYTRHPNYFGDAVIWWSFWVFAIGVHWGFATVLSPLLMTFLLLKISGVALLEKDISDRRPEYRRYIETTPAFFPGIPTEASGSGEGSGRSS